MEHPEEMKRLHEMKNVLEVMARVEEKEVIAPPIFMDEEPVKKTIWLNGHVKTAMGIAASFLLLIVAAKLLGTEISYTQSELRISFGTGSKVQSTEQLQSLSAEQVQQMINSSLVKNNEAIAASWSENQQKLDEAVRHSLALNSKKIDGLMKSSSQASQQQVSAFVASLQSENVKTMQQYLQLSSAEQNKYMENLLVDFTKYLNEQRNQDLQLFQTRLTTVEKDTDQFKQETEQILASIISSGGGSRNQNSSY